MLNIYQTYFVSLIALFFPVFKKVSGMSGATDNSKTESSCKGIYICVYTLKLWPFFNQSHNVQLPPGLWGRVMSARRHQWPFPEQPEHRELNVFHLFYLPLYILPVLLQFPIMRQV